MVSTHFSKLALLATLIPLCYTSKTCQLQGPVFLAPQSLSSSSTFKSAIANLTSLIKTATSSGNTSYGPLFDGHSTSFSLEIFSAHEQKPLLTTHYSAPALTSYHSGTKTINSTTTYRLGSITKLISIYTFLISAGDAAFNHPVTKYVPELLAAAKSTNASADPLDYVSWEDITLGELASHLSGLGRDYAGFGQLGGFLIPVSDPAALGLPPLNASEEVLCQGGGYCSRAQFFAGFTKRHPVYAPSTAPIYANAPFQILAYALENITGTPFPTLVQDNLFRPLNLKGSSWTLPTSNASAVIPDGSSWALNLGDETPAGGMYSTITDLTTIARSILTSSLLSPTLTRRWMKPRSFTSSILSAVGAPWEIFRFDALPNGHIVDVYTKNGDLPGYSSILVVIPDWDIGFSILAAGQNPDSNVALLANIISDTLFPAIEEAAREAADHVFSGRYASADKSLNSSITLASSPSQPGLLVTSWISNNTKMLTSFLAGPSIHMYPIDLTHKLASSGETEVGFRAVYENPKATVLGGMFGNGCVSWAGVDQLYWGDVASDEFMVTVGKDGRAKSVRPRFLEVDLVRRG